MGNTQVCKECQTFSHRPDNKSLSSSNRTPVTVTLNGKPVTQSSGPKIEALPGNKFRIQYQTGEIYVGEAVGEVRHGQGRMDWPQENSYYEGAWDNNSASGEGTYHQGGALYVGLFKNNEIVKGKYVSANGKEEYQGQFSGNRFEGQGRLKKVGQYVYVGQFHNNLKNGRGHISFDNGNEFQGDFLNGKFHGQGTFRSPTHTYQGQFRDGQYHGQGKYTWSSGNYYEGRYELGEKSGFGVYQNMDGSRFQGNWLHGKRHGQGVEVSVQGERTQCQFQNGSRVS